MDGFVVLISEYRLKMGYFQKVIIKLENLNLNRLLGYERGADVEKCQFNYKIPNWYTHSLILTKIV